MKQILAFVFLASTLFTSCIDIPNTYDQLPPGIWRGILLLENQNFTPEAGDEEVITMISDLNDSEIPFNFEVSYDENNEMGVTFINGTERIPTSKIDYGKNIRTAKDTLRIHFPEFDSYLRASYEDNSMEGKFVINSLKNYFVPFKAEFGQAHRFSALKKEPITDLTGLWECTFEEGTEDEYKAVGEFKQNGNELRGTFRTETGDYRFLEGTIQDNKAYLSVFDGTHAFLFTMKILDQDEMIGSFRSGKTYQASWRAKRNPKATLAKASELTYVVKDSPPIAFNYPDRNGKMVNLENPIFQDKIKVISIMGTWCPNCKDEMNYLKSIQDKFEDVQVVAIAYERYREQEKALESLDRYSKVMELNFPMLHGGMSSKSEASTAWPQFNEIISFPTLLVLDKQNEVKYVHTGFNGPATSKYKEFVDEFEAEINKLRE